MKNRKLVIAGFLVPLVFWSTTIICGFMTEDYSHLSNMVSELGTIGTNTQYLFTTGLVLSSILSIFFIVGLYNIAKRASLNVTPILIIVTFSFSIFGAAIFPLPLKLHGILGFPALILPLSPLLALILWNASIIPNIKIASGIILIIMLLGFLTFTPEILDSYFGLKQRFYHIGWSLWFIYLSITFLKINKKQISKHAPLSDEPLPSGKSNITPR